MRHLFTYLPQWGAALGFIALALACTAGQQPQSAPSANLKPHPERPVLDSLLARYEQLVAERKAIRRRLQHLPLPTTLAQAQQHLEAERERFCTTTKTSATRAAADTVVQGEIRLQRRELRYAGRVAHYQDSLHRLGEQQLGATTRSLQGAAEAAGQLLRTRRGGFAFRLHGTVYRTYVADLTNEAVHLYLNRDSTSAKFTTLEHLRTYLMQHGQSPAMLTNAGMFHASQEPVGLLIEHGQLRYPLNTRRPTTDENFYLQPNGVFFIDSQHVGHIDSTGGYQREASRYQVQEATQSGPMLVVGGQLNPHFSELSTNAKVRSGVGILNSSGNRILFLTTEGESTFYDFATTFRDLFGCANALFLDGAISRMYLAGEPAISGGFFGPLLSVSARQPAITGAVPGTPAVPVGKAAKLQPAITPAKKP